MKTHMKRIALFALALVLILLPMASLAESDALAGQDGAGNLLAVSGGTVGQTIESDLYGLDANVDVTSCQIGESAILAGQNITVNNSTIGGSLRAAGYSISAIDTTVNVNATLAGYSLNMDPGFTARAVYGAAYTIGFSGECETMILCANSVTINGKVNGNANVYANNVVIGPDAQISGTLNVTAANEPIIPATAQVGAVSFTQSVAEDATEVVETVSPILRAIRQLTMMLPGRILLAVLFYFIIRKSVESASNMLKTRPAAVPVTGLVALIVIPIAAVVLLFTYIGVPVGLLLICLYALALAFSVSFAGCMAGRLAFPKLHPLLAYIIGVSALTVLKLIPYLGGLLTFACMLCTLGYFIQAIYLGFGKKSSANSEQAAADSQLKAPADPSSTEQL